MTDTIKNALPNRDHIVWILGIFGGIIIYLSSNKPPSQWDYYQWLAALGFAVSTISAQMSSSKLPGAK